MNDFKSFKCVEVRQPHRFGIVLSYLYDSPIVPESPLAVRRRQLICRFLRRARMKRVILRVSCQILAAIVLVGLTIAMVLALASWLHSIGMRIPPMTGFVFGLGLFFAFMVTMDWISDLLPTDRFRFTARHRKQIFRYSDYL